MVPARDSDAAIRDLCARLFARPASLTHTVTHRIARPFHFARHSHKDLLQFDLLVGCGGRAWCDGRWVALRRGSALVAYPGDEHGYELEPGNAEGTSGEDPALGGLRDGRVERASGLTGGRVYHLRMRVGRSWPAVRDRVFAGAATDLSSVEALASAMRVVMRLGVIEAVRPPLLVARLCEALALWPGACGVSGVSGLSVACGGDSSEEAERGLAAAVDLIERRLTDPPSSEALARVACFSVRHFARRFRAAYGCTPHGYITARRYALARQLLSQERLSVTHVADELGFGSVATFSRWFSQQAGLSPTAFRGNPSLM